MIALYAADPLASTAVPAPCPLPAFDARTGATLATRIRHHRLHRAIEHPVLLERIGRELQPHCLPRAHEPNVLVLHRHLGAQRLIGGDETQDHGARLDDRTDGRRGEFLHRPRLRRAEFQVLLAVLELGALLLELRELLDRVGAQGVQIALIVTLQLRHAARRLVDGGFETRSRCVLRGEILCLLGRQPSLLLGLQLADELLTRELLVGRRGTLVTRQGLLQLALGLAGGREFLGRPLPRLLFLGNGIEQGLVVRRY